MAQIIHPDAQAIAQQPEGVRARQIERADSRQTTPDMLRWGRLLAFLLCLLPVYLLLLLIERYAVNVPFWDEWVFLDSYLNFRGLESLGIFWQIHNEHRIFFPRLLGWVVGNMTGFSMVALILINLALMVFCAFIIYNIYSRKGEAPHRYIIVLPTTLLLLSLASWPRWIETRPLALHMAIAATLGAIWVITTQKPGWKTLLIAAALSYVAAFSYFTGNVTWIVIGLMLWFARYRKPSYYAAWVIMALTAIIPYALEYFLRPSITRDAGSIGPEIIPFVMAMIGAPWTAGNPARVPWGADVPIVLGLLGLLVGGALALVVSVRVQRGFQKALPWFGLMLWVGGNAAAAAIGRIETFGVLGALNERFIVYGTLYWVGILALAWMVITEPRTSRPLRRGLEPIFTGVFPVLVVFGMGIGYVNSSAAAISFGRIDAYSKLLTEGRACLLMFEIAPNACLEKIYPDAKTVRLLAPALLERGSPIMASANRQLALQYAEITASAAAPARADQVTIQGQSYSRIFAHPPSILAWRLSLPASYPAVFKTDLLVDIPADPIPWRSDGVLFRIEILEDDVLEEYFEKLVMPRTPEKLFEPIEIALDAYVGRTVQLRLITAPGLDSQATPTYDWASWVTPHIEYGERLEMPAP